MILKKQSSRNGTCKVTFERWENDWAADAYLPNDLGGDDSVIDV